MSTFDLPKEPRKAVAKQLKEYIRYRQGFKCKKCSSSLKRRGQIHHKNGNRSDSSFGNLELLCKKCHLEKTRKQIKVKQVKNKPNTWFV